MCAERDAVRRVERQASVERAKRFVELADLVVVSPDIQTYLRIGIVYGDGLLPAGARILIGSCRSRSQREQSVGRAVGENVGHVRSGAGFGESPVRIRQSLFEVGQVRLDRRKPATLGDVGIRRVQHGLGSLPWMGSGGRRRNRISLGTRLPMRTSQTNCDDQT